jgi:hypothetical protein
MFGLLLVALAGAPAPQDTVPLDAPVYRNAMYQVALPRPFDDWVFEPATAQRTTTVIFHPRGRPLRDQLWGVLVLTTFAGPVDLQRVVRERVGVTWHQLLGRSFTLVGTDSLSLSGFPAIRVSLSGTIDRVPLRVEEYLLARDSDLIILQLRRPRSTPLDSVQQGFERVVAGLTIGRPGSGIPSSIRVADLADSLPTARVVPRSPWRAVGYDAVIRYDSATARADFEVRADLVNAGADDADLVSAWLWPGLTLDSVRASPLTLESQTVGSVSWVHVPAGVPPHERATLTYFYHAEDPGGALPRDMMGLSAAGAYAVTDWLPTVQPAIDSAGQREATARPAVTVQFDLPLKWRGVFPGRLASEVDSGSRHRMTWRSDDVAESVPAFAVGPYQLTTRAPGRSAVSYWSLSGDSETPVASGWLLGTVRAAWAFYSRAFGPLPIGEVAVATAPLPSPAGFAGLLLVPRSTVSALADSGAPARRDAARQAVFREVARAWWGGSVAGAGPGSAWMTRSLPAWSAVAARGVLEGDSVRQRLDREADAAWHAVVSSGGDRPLAALPLTAPDSGLLASKGVLALEAVRRAIGEARFREAIFTLALEHRNGWLTIDDVLAAVGPAGSSVLRPYLY